MNKFDNLALGDIFEYIPKLKPKIISNNASIEDVIKEVTLRYSGEIYLFGSRSKLPNDLVKNSDFDFVVQQGEFSSSPCAFIQDDLYEGWHEYYNDDNGCFDHLTKCVLTVIIKGILIQISVRSDLELFKKSWESIDNEYFKKYLWKKSPDYIGKNRSIEYFNSLYKKNVEIL